MINENIERLRKEIERSDGDLWTFDVEDVSAVLAEIDRLREKHVKKEITKIIPGGGKCPSCEVRLIGKANYCGKCGQRVGWEVYGGNIYDNNGGGE